jgi:high-affinity iron transporter
MKNSKEIFYSISSGFLMVVLLFPTYNIMAQEEENGEESDPLTILSTIRNLLDKSITEINAGNYTGASELVDIAYIDNYEYIEGPLEELDSELMEETEVMIREDLANAIEDKKPLEEITTLHNNIKSNLDTAEKLFQQ